MTASDQEPWIPQDTFGARLALVRQRMHWNIAEAATACGLGDENWRQWERGRSPRNLQDVAEAIAARTGCDLTWLMMGTAGGRTLRRNDARGWCPQVIEGGRRGPRRPSGPGFVAARGSPAG